MKPRIVAMLLFWALIFQVKGDGEARSGTATLSAAKGQRHHYMMSARVRPLLFWIGRDNVGDAVLATRRAGDAVGYTLLIGSDPDRAPRRINRWGYIDEDIHGHSATLVGLMTESDEESVSQAEASLRKAAGQRTFNVIRASIADGEARSVVTSIATPNDYTLHHVDTVLDLASRAPDSGKTRVIRFPAGTRPGFLAAIADVMHGQVSQWHASRQVAPGEPITYVYHGKLYQLRVTHTRALGSVDVGDTTYEHVIESDGAPAK